MKIPTWRVLLFFAILFAISLFIVPTSRELGWVFSSQQDYPQAEKYLRRDYKQHPQDISNDLRYLEALDHNLQFQQYEEVADQLLQRFPDDPQLHQAVGNYYETNLRLGEASQQWAEVVRLDPTNTDTREKLLSYYSLSQNYAGLTQTYQTLISQGVARPDDYLELGRLYTARGENQQAAQVYAQLLGRDSKNSAGLVRLAEIWEAEGKTDEALSLYEAAAETDPKNQDYALLYLDRAFKLNRGEETNAALKRYLKRFPNDQQFQLQIAYLYTQNGDLDGALSVLQRIHQENPTQPETVYMMAEIYQRQGKTDLLIDLLRTYNESAPSDYQTYEMLGDAYQSAGRTKEANAQYQKALAILESVGARSFDQQLAELSLRQKIGTNPPTVQEVRALFEANPSSAAAADLTFSIALEGKETDLADQAFQRFQALSPNDPSLLEKRASLLFAESKWREAVQAYAQLIQAGRASRWDRADYATALGNAHQYNKALQVLEGLREESPNDFSIVSSMSDFLLKEGRVDGAIDLLCQFAQSHPDDPRAYIQIGEILSARHDEERAKCVWWQAYEVVQRVGIGKSVEERLRAINLFINLERYCEAQCHLGPLLDGDPTNRDLLAAALAIAFQTQNYRRGRALLEWYGDVVSRCDMTYLNYRIMLMTEMKCWWEAKHLLEQAICVEPREWGHQHDYGLVLMQLNGAPLAKRVFKSLYWQWDRDFAFIWDMRQSLLDGGHELMAEATFFSGVTKIDYQIYRETARWWLNDHIRLSVGANEEHYHEAGNLSLGQVPFSSDIFGVFGRAELLLNSTTTVGVVGGLPWLEHTLIPFVGVNGLYRRNSLQIAFAAMYNEILRLPIVAVLYQSKVNRVLLSAENIYYDWLHVGVSGWWEWYRLNPALNPIGSQSNLGNKWFFQPFIGVVAISDAYRYIELTMQFLASNWHQGFPGAASVVDLLPEQRVIQVGAVAKQRWRCAEFEGAVFEAWDWARRVNMVLLRALLNLWFTECYVGTWGFDYQIGDSGLASLGSSWILYLSLRLLF
jgi:tetratricopeptide (TPR) repeat protein